MRSLLLVCFGVALGLAALGSGCRGEPPLELDPPGRLLLDDLRQQALEPAALVARLRLPAGAVVADVGAGPGFLTLPLARAAARVIATDVRADYLAVLERRARAAGVRNIETRLVPPADPSLAPGSVDVALLCQVDHALVDRAGYLAVLAPALKTGGRIVLVNAVRYRELDRAAARAAHLRVVDEWQPSPPFFLLALERDPS